MKQKIAIGLVFALLLALLGACSKNQPGTQTSAEESSQGTEAVSNPEESSSPVQSKESEAGGTESSSPAESGKSEVNEMEIPQTGWTEAVPAEYTQAAAEQGAVVRLDYESEDYVRDSSPITKTAYVYTPYGYDEADAETRYNILYLMHGWGGHAGEYFDFTATKNMFDNLIANGNIPPIIIVSATFYNENSSTDFSSSIEEFRAFHQDFENHLMPAVEGGGFIPTPRPPRRRT